MQKIGFDSFFDIYSSLNITPQQTRKKTPKIRKIQIAIKSGKIDQIQKKISEMLKTIISSTY